MAEPEEDGLRGTDRYWFREVESHLPFKMSLFPGLRALFWEAEGYLLWTRGPDWTLGGSGSVTTSIELLWHGDLGLIMYLSYYYDNQHISTSCLNCGILFCARNFLVFGQDFLRIFLLCTPAIQFSISRAFHLNLFLHEKRADGCSRIGICGVRAHGKYSGWRHHLWDIWSSSHQTQKKRPLFNVIILCSFVVLVLCLWTELRH